MSDSNIPKEISFRSVLLALVILLCTFAVENNRESRQLQHEYFGNFYNGTVEHSKRSLKHIRHYGNGVRRGSTILPREFWMPHRVVCLPSTKTDPSHELLVSSQVSQLLHVSRGTFLQIFLLVNQSHDDRFRFSLP